MNSKSLRGPEYQIRRTRKTLLGAKSRNWQRQRVLQVHHTRRTIRVLDTEIHGMYFTTETRLSGLGTLSRATGYIVRRDLVVGRTLK